MPRGAGRTQRGERMRTSDPATPFNASDAPKGQVSVFWSLQNKLILIQPYKRGVIIDAFPAAPGRPVDIAAYLKATDDNYARDAYHSLSIEGYRVSPELIEHVRSGQWDPDEDMGDRQMHDALAARGYGQAYQSVRGSLRKVLEEANPGVCVKRITATGTGKCSHRKLPPT
jgi:hypothetical protein